MFSFHTYVSNKTYVVFIYGNWKHQLRSILLEEGQKTAVRHERHDNVGGWTSINTHTHQTDNVRMVEVFHFHTLIHHVFNILLPKVS